MYDVNLLVDCKSFTAMAAKLANDYNVGDDLEVKALPCIDGGYAVFLNDKIYKLPKIEFCDEYYISTRLVDELVKYKTSSEVFDVFNAISEVKTRKEFLREGATQGWADEDVIIFSYGGYDFGIESSGVVSLFKEGLAIRSWWPSQNCVNYYEALSNNYSFNNIAKVEQVDYIFQEKLADRLFDRLMEIRKEVVGC